MIIPSIHLGGTDKNDLLVQLTAASSGIQKAIDALAQAAPNERDHYDTVRFRCAINAHKERVGLLVRMKEDYDAAAIAVDAQ